MSEIDILSKLVFDGARSKNLEINDLTLDRLSLELSAIEKLNQIEYFLIYAKIIEICNAEGLLRSYGRGSASGSLVNYCLDITKINPLKYGLIFERFLNPLAAKFVDIDIDIPSGYQEWVVKKLKAELPTYFIYFLATLPSDINEKNIDLGINNRTYKKHACGVIITSDKRPDAELIATYENTEYYHSQDVKNDLLIEYSKFDILELDYLNKLDLIAKKIGPQYHPYNLPLDDKLVFEFFKKGDLSNIFQFKATSLKKIFAEFMPDSIEDLCIIHAMFRPGSFNNIPHLIHNKQNGCRNWFPSDLRVQNILSETYGLLVYQETFIILLNEISGFTYSEAELFRRKLTWTKDHEEIAQLKTRFVIGCKENSSLKVEEIEQLAQLILGQIMLVFNKSHSLCYSIIAYWGAYYKTHFEKEFDAIFN